jgi:hypothetical protein
MSPDRGVGNDARTEALLKECEVTAQQQRRAGIRLAGRALAAADGDQQAAKGMLRPVLEAVGIVSYEPRERPKTSRMQVDRAYRRPGQ